MPVHCPCGKPIWNTRKALAQGLCVICGELAIRRATIKRLVKSGAMALMLRSLEAAEDGRTRALPCSEVDESKVLAVSLLVGMAMAERDSTAGGERALRSCRRKW